MIDNIFTNYLLSYYYRGIVPLHTFILLQGNPPISYFHTITGESSHFIPLSYYYRGIVPFHTFILLQGNHFILSYYYRGIVPFHTFILLQGNRPHFNFILLQGNRPISYFHTITGESSHLK